MTFRIVYVEDDESCFIILRETMLGMFGNRAELIWVNNSKMLHGLQNCAHLLLLDDNFPGWENHLNEAAATFPKTPKLFYTAELVEKNPGERYSKDTEGRVMMINCIWEMILKHESLAERKAA